MSHSCSRSQISLDSGYLTENPWPPLEPSRSEFILLANSKNQDNLFLLPNMFLPHFAVDWPQVWQNECSFGRLGSHLIPNCVFSSQTERGFKIGLISDLPQAGQFPLEKQKSAGSEPCCSLGQQTGGRSLAYWPHDWAKWLGQLPELWNVSEIMQESFCCILHSHFNIRMS